MAKRSLKRNIIIASLIVVASFITIGVSTYVIKLDTFNSITNSNDNPIDYDDLVEVEIGYKWYTDYSETKTDPEQIGGGEYGTFTYNNNNGEFTNIGYISVSDETSYNKINNFYKKYRGNDNVELNNNDKYTFLSTKADETLGIKKDTTEITIQCKDEDPIKKVTTTGTCGSSTTYSGSYFVYKQEVTKSFTSESNSDFEDSSSTETFYVPKNSILQDDIINTYTDNIYENKTYSFNKFVKVDDNGAETDFDWKNTPITESINLYAVFNTTNTSVPLYSNITKTINDASTNGAEEPLKIYAGASDIDCNVTSDSTYFSLDNSFSLGDKNTEIHIAEGVTVNFCLNNGEVSIENTTDTGKQRVEPDTQYLQYKIILQNDLNIDGTMTIASRYGSWRNIYQEGNIADAYVWLDLNGHDINIGPNGTLENYGLITDSKGNGGINVNGGTLQSITVIQDYKGGSSTEGATSSKTFPFVLYHIPYLRCSTKFYYDASNNSWGKLIGFVNIRATNEQFGGLIPIQHGNALIHFLGNDNQSFFQIEAPTKSGAYIELDIEKNDMISENISTYESNSMYTKCLDYRMKWSFNNIVFKFYPIEVELISVSVQTKEYSFPISPFFDIYINNSELTFSQRINLLPGSSMILDKNSRLIFDYVSNDTDSTANFFVFDKPIYFYNNEKTYFYNKAFPTAPGTGNEFWSSDVYWRYYDAPICYNYGQTLFKQGNPSSQPYVLAGNYNFNKIGYIDSNNNVHIVEDDSNGTIFEKLNNNNTYVNTISYDYISSSRYSGLGGSSHEAINVKAYGLSLISYGFAYINYNGNYIKGTWDEDNYLIVSGNDNYFIYLETVTYNTTPSLDILDSKSISVQQISSINLDNKTIIYNNGTYALFAGLYLPIYSEGSTYKANMARLYYDKNASSNSIKTITFSNGYWHI